MIDEKKLIEEITKYHNGLKPSYITRLVDSVFADILDIINEQPKLNEWITVSDRLPEDRKEKLVYLSSNRIAVAVYNEHRLPHSDCSIGWGYRVPDGYIDFEKETVIAWQPLPKPYREKVEE